MRQLIVAVLVLLGCAACTSAASQAPGIQTPAPTSGPESTPPTVNQGELPDRPAPDLRVTWTPNLNWKHQQAVTTHGTARQGRALLHDIRASKKVSGHARYSCPIDFGVHARFTYRAQHGNADLGGCRFVQLGQRTYWTDRAIVHDLRALAPHRWLPYLKLRGLK